MSCNWLVLHHGDTAIATTFFPFAVPVVDLIVSA